MSVAETRTNQVRAPARPVAATRQPSGAERAVADAASRFAELSNAAPAVQRHITLQAQADASPTAQRAVIQREGWELWEIAKALAIPMALVLGYVAIYGRSALQSLFAADQGAARTAILESDTEEEEEEGTEDEEETEAEEEVVEKTSSAKNQKRNRKKRERLKRKKARERLAAVEEDEVPVEDVEEVEDVAWEVEEDEDSGEWTEVISADERRLRSQQALDLPAMVLEIDGYAGSASDLSGGQQERINQYVNGMGAQGHLVVQAISDTYRTVQDRQRNQFSISIPFQGLANFEIHAHCVIGTGEIAQGVNAVHYKHRNDRYETGVSVPLTMGQVRRLLPDAATRQQSYLAM